MQVLFLRAPASPGTVVRFLQRRWGGDPDGRARLNRLGFLLSDALPPDGWRALASDAPEALAWMRMAGPILAPPFPPSVTLLQASETVWDFQIWPGDGGAEERGGGPKEQTARRGLLPRLLNIVEPSPEVAWARERGLPIERVPAADPSAPPPRLVDWATVAGLVERNLLVEGDPRLYRLVWD